MRFDLKGRRNLVRNPKAPEPKLRKEVTLTDVVLYAAACIKVGEYSGLAMAEKHKGQKAQYWKAYYKALEVKEERYKSLLSL